VLPICDTEHGLLPTVVTQGLKVHGKSGSEPLSPALLLDNNVLASDFGLEQIEEIVRMGISVDFNQGLDARQACDDAFILDLLSRVKWMNQIRFACDRMSQMEPVAKCVKELGRRGVKP
jgi:hypothetical protein